MIFRFKRLSGGSEVLSIQQFELIPELAGNPYLPRLFEMFAKDQSQISQVNCRQRYDCDNHAKAYMLHKSFGVLQGEFNTAIDSFLKAQSPDERMQRTSLAIALYNTSCGLCTDVEGDLNAFFTV